MLLLRDARTRAKNEALLDEHTRLVRSVLDGTADLDGVHAAKLLRTVRAAAGSPMYEGRLPADLLAEIDAGTMISDERALTEILPSLPLLGKRELGRFGAEAFTRPLNEFLHYYESSGTTGDPAAAPKALDDLLVNTVNIGEMWARLLQPEDIALILINAPFAPAAYQFEKALEYLEVMSLRPWVDNITGDYTRVLRLVDQLGANVFVGPPSRLLEMVQFAHRNDLPAPRFDRLLLMAEQTGPSFRRHLERLTGAQSYVSSYGSSETGTPAVTCERGQLHLQPQSFLLELADDNGIRRIGNTSDRGELVLTTLDLPARPLLRYRTGDLVEIDATPCPCGVATPVLLTQGRSQDLLVLDRNGIRQNDLEAAVWEQPLPAATVFNYMVVVRGRQVVFLVTYDGDPAGPWTDVLAGRLRALFGREEVTVRPVPVLPPLASLGQYLGWKLSRVLDLDDEKNWDRLPAPIDAVVRQTIAELAPGA
ncbi:phenylacetate--CoA ligase family protein [Nocardia kruczakiae]|uniref:phenylacetate--CoA ligase family protein n=1 Tax=Nocardia kruczakiae TaxID=261477 RepID=UPI0007A3D83C|nr:phenylacetate--CoA ligase family protein [Nocardia kruczakiae]